MKKKVCVLVPDDHVREIFLPQENVEKANVLFDVHWNESKINYTPEELYEVLKDAEAVITGWGSTRIGADTLPPDSPLKIISHTGGTMGPYIDETVYARGIKVCSANEMYAESVAEGAIAYMLSGLRMIPYWNKEVHAGAWSTPQSFTRGLLNRRVGLTGYGAITRNLVRMLKAFNVEILLNSGHLSEEQCAEIGVKKAELDEIFSTCSVISLHNSLTAKTQGLVTERHIQMMQPGTVFVNTSRGGVVDEKALTNRLVKGDIVAVLDVFYNEPPEADSRLRGLENAILLPHMAGPTSDRRTRIGSEMINEVARFFNGEALKYEISEAAAGRMTANG